MAKEKEKTAGKEKRIYIRVTKEEHEMITEKSKKYGFSISTLMLDAVKEFDDRKGRNRIDRMIEFSEAVKGFDTDMVRIGNNLNQIAHALNLYKYGNTDLVPLETIHKTILEVQEINKDAIRAIRHIANKSRR